METLLLPADAVEANATYPEVVDAVEAAFAAYARGDAIMPPKSYVDLPQYNGDFRSMPAYLRVRGDDGHSSQAGTRSESVAVGEWDAAGVKWVNVHTDNPVEFGLPTVLGTMIYSDPRNAYPLSIMDGTSLTRLRTGAAAAVATRHLAVSDARTLGIVGAGAQAYTQLDAIASVRQIETVVIADRNETKQREFVSAFSDRFDVRAGSIEEAAGCDVLSTVTPVEEPIVPRAAVGERTHVNAMGADAAGKHELDDRILLDAKLVIDDYEQCVHSGEVNVPWSAGVLGEDDLYGTIGEVVGGEKAGRTPDDGITVFDSTGLAIQDVAAAHVAYERAKERGDGVGFQLVDADVTT